ncbi:MAG: NfeD family protein [Myxococcales bacterium]
MQTAPAMERYGWEIWGALALLLLGGEVYTQHFVLLWPAVGAAGAAIGAAVGLSMEAQLVLFALASIALLAAGRPLFLRILSHEGRSVATNVEALPGKRVEVMEKVAGPGTSGTVKVGGERWSAFTEDGAELAAGTPAVVVRVEGLKLCVKPTEDWKTRRVP